MTFIEIINLIALIAAPIIAVFIGQYLQNRAEKRKDKVEVFKILMTNRVGFSAESVRALNIIDIVFSDNKEVLLKWKDYYNLLCIQNPNQMQLKQIQTSQDKFLESIAVALGYKHNITWETIQNPYIPKWMVDEVKQQQQFKESQLAVAKLAETMCQSHNSSQVGKPPMTQE